MNPFEMFETNEDLEKDGVWQDFSTFKVLLARSGGRNTAWFKEVSKAVKKSGKASFEAIDTDEKVDIIRTIFCSSVIKDHQVKDEDGKWKQGVFLKKDGKVTVVPFNVENMKKCLEQLPEYFNKLQEWADNYKTFQDKIEEEQVKN